MILIAIITIIAMEGNQISSIILPKVTILVILSIFTLSVCSIVVYTRSNKPKSNSLSSILPTEQQFPMLI